MRLFRLLRVGILLGLVFWAGQAFAQTQSNKDPTAQTKKVKSRRKPFLAGSGHWEYSKSKERWVWKRNRQLNNVSRMGVMRHRR